MTPKALFSRLEHAKYAPALFGFVATLIGILGDTHDSARPGVAGITALGWGAIVVAALAFLVIYWQARQRAKIAHIGDRLVVRAVMRLLTPFGCFLRETWQKPNDLGLDLDQLDTNAAYIIDQLSKPAVRAEFGSVDLRAKPNVYPPLLWWEYFAECASQASESLDRISATYIEYLDTETLVFIQDLLEDDLISFRLARLGENISANSHIVPLTLSYVFDGPGGYEDLNAMLRKLRAVLDHLSSERPINV
jgi:hypothetical protein